MLSFEELKELIENLPMEVDKDDRATIEVLKKVASQLGYTIPDCKCHDKWSDLAVKLKLWSRNHPTECHYQIRPGIVRRTPFGNAYNLVLTDEMAEWILINDPEGAKYIRRIASDGGESDPNVINQPTINNGPETKKRGRKKKEVNHE